MRRAEALLVMGIAISLSGCVLHKQQTAKATPAAPRPVAAPPPAPPPEPLSTPQTTVQLPPPQPLTPEAIATTELPGEPEPTPPKPTRTPANRPARGAVSPPRTEQAPAAAPAPAPAATAPAAEETPQLSEVLPAAELKRFQDEAESRKQEVRKLVDQISKNRRTRQEQATIGRIETFLKQADDAERRGDMRQASELAGRALVLARELKQ